MYIYIYIYIHHIWYVCFTLANRRKVDMDARLLQQHPVSAAFLAVPCVRLLSVLLVCVCVCVRTFMHTLCMFHMYMCMLRPPFPLRLHFSPKGSVPLRFRKPFPTRAGDQLLRFVQESESSTGIPESDLLSGSVPFGGKSTQRIASVVGG